MNKIESKKIIKEWQISQSRHKCHWINHTGKDSFSHYQDWCEYPDNKAELHQIVDYRGGRDGVTTVPLYKVRYCLYEDCPMKIKLRSDMKERKIYLVEGHDEESFMRAGIFLSKESAERHLQIIYLIIFLEKFCNWFRKFFGGFYYAYSNLRWWTIEEEIVKE
jgi:hypothetical protein